MTSQHLCTLSVPATHPALPGHFPDAPVVPGVLLLDLVLQATEAWLGHAVSVSTIDQVKFHTPLLPEECASAVLQLEGNRLRFRIEREGALIAQGSFTLHPPASV